MVRSIAAVIVSYIVMAVLVIGMFAGLWFGLGPDRLLQPGSWKGNMLLTVAAPAITAFAGLLGGWMCAKIARARKPVMVLAGIVLVLGMVTTYYTLQEPEPTGPRDPGLTAEEILAKGREPTWLAILNPILGAGTVLIGGLYMAAPRRPA